MNSHILGYERLRTIIISMQNQDNIISALDYFSPKAMILQKIQVVSIQGRYQSNLLSSNHIFSLFVSF